MLFTVKVVVLVLPALSVAVAVNELLPGVNITSGNWNFPVALAVTTAPVSSKMIVLKGSV